MSPGVQVPFLMVFYGQMWGGRGVLGFVKERGEMTHCSHYYIFSRRMANHVIGEVNRRKAEHRLVYNNKISTTYNIHVA